MLFDVFKRKPVKAEVTSEDIEKYLEEKHYPNRKWKIDLAYKNGKITWALFRNNYNAHLNCPIYEPVGLFDTKEEALAKLEEIKDSPYYYD